jgi:hypothetical protein
MQPTTVAVRSMRRFCANGAPALARLAGLPLRLPRLPHLLLRLLQLRLGLLLLTRGVRPPQPSPLPLDPLLRGVELPPGLLARLVDAGRSGARRMGAGRRRAGRRRAGRRRRGRGLPVLGEYPDFLFSRTLGDQEVEAEERGKRDQKYRGRSPRPRPPTPAAYHSPVPWHGPLGCGDPRRPVWLLQPTTVADRGPSSGDAGAFLVAQTPRLAPRITVLRCRLGERPGHPSRRPACGDHGRERAERIRTDR